MSERDGQFFEVEGAGKLWFSPNAHALCANAVGFAIGVSWTNHPYIGGVIGRTEAKRLAEFILAKCAECPETEEEERQRQYKDMLNPSKRID